MGNYEVVGKTAESANLMISKRLHIAAAFLCTFVLSYSHASILKQRKEMNKEIKVSSYPA